MSLVILWLFENSFYFYAFLKLTKSYLKLTLFSKDFDAAEEYCACVEEASAWNALVAVCATPCEGFMFDRMIDLLRRRPNQFDAAFALSILPGDVKIDAIAPFLNFSVREMLHEKRMKQVCIDSQC